MLPIPAFPVERIIPAGDLSHEWNDWISVNYPFNMTGRPVVLVPCGFISDGLPVSL